MGDQSGQKSHERNPALNTAAVPDSAEFREERHGVEEAEKTRQGTAEEIAGGEAGTELKNGLCHRRINLALRPFSLSFGV